MVEESHGMWEMLITEGGTMCRVDYTNHFLELSAFVEIDELVNHLVLLGGGVKGGLKV